MKVFWMNSKVIAVIVVVIILIAGVALYIVSLKLGGSVNDSTGTTGVSGTSAGKSAVQYVSDNLTVGFQSGLWTVTLRNTGVSGISYIVVYLLTPVESKLCGGTTEDAGLAFINCQLQLPGNPFPSGSILSGTGSGIGEGSAKVGSAYPVGAELTFSNGTVVWVNSTVTAQSPS